MKKTNVEQPVEPDMSEENDGIKDLENNTENYGNLNDWKISLPMQGTFPDESGRQMEFWVRMETYFKFPPNATGEEKEEQIHQHFKILMKEVKAAVENTKNACGVYPPDPDEENENKEEINKEPEW